MAKAIKLHNTYARAKANAGKKYLYDIVRIKKETSNLFR